MVVEIKKTTAMKETVLRKLRRGSKDGGSCVTFTVPPSRDTSINCSMPAQALDPSQLTFFDLPPELRNAIYDLVIQTTTLTLNSTDKSKENKKGAHLPARKPLTLLLVSKATRHEFMPLLLSTAHIVAPIEDFDFRGLSRISQSLYSTELKALRHNPNLVISLLTRNCSRADLARLRQWLMLRSNALDRLPWRYELAVAVPERSAARERMLHELGFFRRVLSNFGQTLDESLRWELGAVVQAFVDTEEAVKNGMDETLLWRRLEGLRMTRGISGGGTV
ncbi:Hypothetical protein R9X50_00566200 [Acrodontium crateriforme]|uniref:F-box domain-containing protein n=1 Tax=Acrodontium crateriforme TaxID=150365 RepID=A0AAQ3M6Y7_9PEZI|nr:Hypothetical protein R9X50_00566200 [Acrodontium crateriforme]